MTSNKSLGARIAVATIAGLLLLPGSNLALAKKGQSKWPIAMGEITKVDGAKKLVEIKDADGQPMTFRVTPQTELEQERERPVKFVWSADFSDLKEGKWVRIRYYGSGNPRIARDIVIFYGTPTR